VLAALPPALATVIVWVSCAPGATGSGASVLVIEMSAAVPTGVFTEAVNGPAASFEVTLPMLVTEPAERRRR
jgi:hypothetical protein